MICDFIGLCGRDALLYKTLLVSTSYSKKKISNAFGVSGSGSATGELGHYGSHPRPQVADRGTPSRMDKRVALDKEGASDKQCLRRSKNFDSKPGQVELA